MARVLVVDDECLVREIVADLLASDGHMVTTAANSAEALEVIHRWQPDAVVLDMMMPDVGAWDFLARYNADSTCRGVPVATLSTAPTAQPALEEAGVLAVIPNAFDLEDLLKTVQELVHKHAAPSGSISTHSRPHVVPSVR